MLKINGKRVVGKYNRRLRSFQEVKLYQGSQTMTTNVNFDYFEYENGRLIGMNLI